MNAWLSVNWLLSQWLPKANLQYVSVNFVPKYVQPVRMNVKNIQCLFVQVSYGQPQSYDYSKSNESDKTILVEGQEMATLLISYIEIKNALVAGDSELASKKAGEFSSVSSVMKMDKMSIEENSVWAIYGEGLKSDASNISKTKKINRQRGYLNDFSNNLFEVLKIFKVNETKIYQQYCDLNKYYWLSESEIIKNPYGTKVLTCGKITAVLD